MPLLFILALSFLKLVSGQWQVIGPGKPVQVLVGEDATFSCALSPEMNAEAMEVRFFRSQFSAVVHMYSEGDDQIHMQMPAYQGRTEFVKDFITQGRVFLKLKNITTSDAGVYGCWFRSQTYYHDDIWELQVSALGSTPLISIMGYVDGGIQLLCKSSGWFPQPTVKWKGPQGHDLPSDSKMNADSHGMIDVETSFIIKEGTGNISCSIQTSALSREVQSSLQIGETFFHPSPWRLGFIFLILICVILSVGVIRMEIFYSKSQGNLWTELDWRRKQRQAEWREARKHAVEVTLDPDTAHPRLHISDMKTVTHLDDPQAIPAFEKRFVKRECVVAHQCFTSGKHYWEVNVGHKKRWQLGVCRDDVNRKGKEGILSPQEGYWIVGLSKADGYFTFNPRRICISLNTSPTRVGIFLDYEGENISFFNVNDQSLIYTLNYKFEGLLLRPFIEPWSYQEENEMPIVICPVNLGPERKTPSQVLTTPDLDNSDSCSQLNKSFLSQRGLTTAPDSSACSSQQ
ncbi:PREDICTED: butyrophilin-like protein 8-like [Elephantulus edwardii]|uniref:butyrophilin-like protein 8-like n=1 Tax=Elephantulus edwardii TaxID=28737 RepID=UPI0003F0E9A3|nr:PREDICTED: butyrophilin-like protein 8-like [Elephantulus edwardii]